MSFDTLGDINYLAALVATVGWAILGIVWFAPPVLGRASFRASGWDLPERPPPMLHMVSSFVLAFVTAVATAWIARETGAETLTDGIVLGLALGVGYTLVLNARTALWERKARPAAWLLINAPSDILGLLIVASIVTVWD